MYLAMIDQEQWLDVPDDDVLHDVIIACDGGRLFLFSCNLLDFLPGKYNK